MYLQQPQDWSSNSSVVSDDAADHTLVELLETEVCMLSSHCLLRIYLTPAITGESFVSDHLHLL